MDDKCGQAFSEVPVAATVGTQQRATPEQIIEIGRQIWADVKKSGVKPEDSAGNDALLARLRDHSGDYNNFATSFPLVFRWIVQARRFSTKALRNYLLKHASAKISSREAFLALQAEYPVSCYREGLAPHPDEKKVSAYRTFVISKLTEEDRDFIEVQKEVDADLARTAAANNAERRALLYKAALAARDAASSARDTGPSAHDTGPSAHDTKPSARDTEPSARDTESSVRDKPLGGATA